MDAAPGPQVSVERIYLRDASFESPKAPDVFAAEWQPKVQVDINASNRHLEGSRYEVNLTVTLEAKVRTASEDPQRDEVALIVEVQQAGIFRLEGMDDALRARVLATTCPATLFPYVREAADSLAVRGSFPPFLLAPMNFDALYAEAQRRFAEDAGFAEDGGGNGDAR